MASVEASPELHAPPGAHVRPDGVGYCVWAPAHRTMSVRIRRRDGGEAALALEPRGDGYFHGDDHEGRAGDRYHFQLADGTLLPDMASRYQPEGVHGPSECIDPRAYRWRCADWRPPGWQAEVIYELHVGTFTPEGTFRAAIAKLDHVRELGATAIEIMPVADFPGERNWGYDGVMLYAPARCYGHPDDLRALVDEAHERGLTVILDVVYNHLGPDGNYLGQYSPDYFHPRRETPWGKAFNLSGPRSGPVREFFLANAVYWIEEFRIDGLRLDATHAIEDQSPRHLVAEIAAAVHQRGGFVIAEDERNYAGLMRKRDGRGLQVDAVWADDFHHEMRVALTRTRDAYFAGYSGSPDDVAETLEHGWFYTGQPYAFWDGRARGEPCHHLPPSSFIHCIENHDQVGNRAEGERLEHLVSPAEFRAASALLCLSPYPPLLFMGQEWAASRPFQYFTDHHGELGRLVTEGRKKEFAGLHRAGVRVPDPQAAKTFQDSKLRWDERGRRPHSAVLELYRECLRQRAQWLTTGATRRTGWQVEALERVVAIRYHGPDQPARLVVCALWGPAQVSLEEEQFLQPPARCGWRLVLDSDDSRFGASGSARLENSTAPQPVLTTLAFAAAATVLLVAEKT